jgi:branched-chain amino acid transport system permease protein
MNKNYVTILLAGFALILLYILPYFIGPYYVYLLTETIIMALLVYSFTFLFSAGYLSLGIAGFYGTGAYTVALLYKHVFSSLYLAFGGAFIVSGIAALIIGYLSIKLEKMYFAIITLAFSEMIHVFILRLRNLTGGEDGISGVIRAPLDFYFFKVSLVSPINYYYFALIFFLIITVVIWRIRNSNFGYTLRCIHDNPERSAFTGINVRKHVLIAFVLCGIFAGLAGAVRASFSGVASPELASVMNTVEPQIAGLLGGVSTLAGPFIGSLVFIFVKASLISIMGNWQLVIGVILVVLVLLFRKGMMGTVSERLKLKL